MQTSVLRKVGGSVMLSVPPALLETLGLSAGSEVGLAVEDGRLVVRPSAAMKKYTLSELLADCDYSDAPTPDDREWEQAPPQGRELL
jgi:antitoxin ChpS